MRFRPTLVVFEGADGAGKTTAIRTYKDFNGAFGIPTIELDFGKRNLVGEKFKISSPNELQTYLTMVQHLDASKVYVQDRGILSNIVYDKLDQLQAKALTILMDNVNLKIVVLDRDFVDQDFEDDLLKKPKDEFNEIIQRYRDLAELCKFPIIKLHPEFDESGDQMLMNLFKTF